MNKRDHKITEWFVDQKQRWDAIKGKGWEFGYPLRLSGWIGISMSKSHVRATFRVGSCRTKRQISEELLLLCEEVANR